MITAVTTFSPKGYRVYGKKMIESFLDYWPEDVRLHVYYEGEKPEDANPRVEWVSLDADQDRKRFMEDHADKPDDPGDFRFRVIRYSHKVWAMTSAPRDRYVIWIDGDTQTIAPVTQGLLEKLLPPDGKTAGYLARPYRYTETGLITFNLNCGGAEFLDELRRVYVHGDIFTLPEWHDCMAFDFARKRFERAGYRFHNLCPGAEGLAVFEQSPLASIVKHNKGPERKHRVYGDPMLTEVA